MNFLDLGTLQSEASEKAFLMSETLINEYVQLLEQGYCIQIGYSGGKDSTVVLNAAIEAMNRSIQTGAIESDHPLVVITVDTLLEPEPIQCYIPHSHNAIRKHCMELGVNLQMQIVTPPFHQQLMILYANAQKLFATASSGRSADCSLIWKVDTSIRALKEIKSKLPLKYRERAWISASGSRSSESVRRSNSMSKIGVKSYHAGALVKDIKNSEGSPKGKVFRFAPISDWSTSDVISYLTNAGVEPISKRVVGRHIAAFKQNFGLLLAIYGEGSNEVCEVVAMDDDNKAEQKGCGKVARFGCVTCGLVSENHSAIESFQYPRWSRFGDATRRFRDYLTRISDDISCRAYHARAYDPSCNNNVFLQPNILKAKYLEKMVWYASQITMDSHKVHEEFVDLYQTGELHKDIGIQDINSDPSLSASVRTQYIEMYTERMLQGPMFTLFSERHAVLLSLLWSLHGVTALPFRPMAIYESVKNGRRIPYPMTNEELNLKRGQQGLVSFQEEIRKKPVPEALVVQLFTPAKDSFAELKSKHKELNVTHLQSLLPFSLDNAWSRNASQFDALGGVFHQPLSLPVNIRKFKLEYSIDTKAGIETVKAKCIDSGKMIPIKHDFLKSELLQLGRKDYLKAVSDQARKSGVSKDELIQWRIEQGCEFGVTCIHEFSNQKLFTSNIKFISDTLRARPRQTKCISARKRKKNQNGQYDVGRASLKVYKASLDSALYQQGAKSISYWLPEDTMIQVNAVGISNPVNDGECYVSTSFNFDDNIFSHWLQSGGWKNCIDIHNSQLKNSIRKRRAVRKYYGTAPVYHLTNTSGLTVAEHFEGYMHATLKRTEVFYQAGLFSLSNLNGDDLVNKDGVITMGQHRSQKTQHLLAIRYLRNKQRIEVKLQRGKQTENQAILNVKSRLCEFLTHYKNICETYLASCAISPFGSNYKLKKQKLEIWLTEFSPYLKDIDSMLELLAVKEESNLIKNDFETKQQLAKEISVQVKQLHSQLEMVSTQTRDLMFKILNTTSAENIKIQNNEYILSDDLSSMVNTLCSWIKSLLPRTNTYLMTHGFGVCLSHINELDYIDSICTVRNGANSDTKKNVRKAKALDNWQSAITELELIQSDFYKHIVTAAHNSDLEVRSRALSKMNSSVKSKKLFDLMKESLSLNQSPLKEAC